MSVNVEAGRWVTTLDQSAGPPPPLRNCRRKNTLLHPPLPTAHEHSIMQYLRVDGCKKHRHKLHVNIFVQGKRGEIGGHGLKSVNTDE